MTVAVSRRATFATAGIVLLAAAMSGVRFAFWFRGKTPLADYAGTELRLRDIPRRLPLTGSYSRVGWFHPGPIVLWFTRPFQVVLGAPGLFVTALVLNLACLAVCCWAVVRAWPRAAAAVVLAVVAAWVVLAFDDLIVDPWNPSTTVLAMLAAVLCVVAVGESPALAYAAVAAVSVAAQSHVACLAPGALLLGATVYARRSRWRSLVLLLGALWIAPLIDLAFGSHNLYHVADDLVAGGEQRLGWGPAVRALAAVFQPGHALRQGRVPVIEYGYLDDQPSGWGWLLLGATVVLCAWVARRGTGASRRLATAVLAGIALAVLSLSGAAVPVFGHVVEWVAILPITGLLVAVVHAADRWQDRLALVPSICAVAAAALAIVAAVRATTPRRVTSVSGDAIPAVARAVIERFGSAPVVLVDDDAYGAGYVVGVADEIERRGGHVKLAGPWGEFGKFGGQRSATTANDCLAHVLVATRRAGNPLPDASGERLVRIALTDHGAGSLVVSLVSPDTCTG